MFVSLLQRQFMYYPSSSWWWTMTSTCATGRNLRGAGVVSQIGLQPSWNVRNQLFIQEYLAGCMSVYLQASFFAEIWQDS
jgi:hypothetical protein